MCLITSLTHFRPQNVLIDTASTAISVNILYCDNKLRYDKYSKYQSVSSQRGLFNWGTYNCPLHRYYILYVCVFTWLRVVGYSCLCHVRYTAQLLGWWIQYLSPSLSWIFIFLSEELLIEPYTALLWNNMNWLYYLFKVKHKSCRGKKCTGIHVQVFTARAWTFECRIASNCLCLKNYK